MGAHSGSFIDITAILSAGTECGTVYGTEFGTEFRKPSFMASMSCLWEGFAVLFKMAETPLKSSLLPVRGVVVCTEIGMLMQDISPNMVQFI